MKSYLTRSVIQSNHFLRGDFLPSQALCAIPNDGSCSSLVSQREPSRGMASPAKARTTKNNTATPKLSNFHSVSLPRTSPPERPQSKSNKRRAGRLKTWAIGGVLRSARSRSCRRHGRVRVRRPVHSTRHRSPLTSIFLERVAHLVRPTQKHRQPVRICIFCLFTSEG